MSIGYTKNGYDTLIQAYKNNELLQNIAYGVVPVSIDLQNGFDTYYIEQDSPLVNRAVINTSTLLSGERLQLELRIKNNNIYEKVPMRGDDYNYISRTDNTLFISFSCGSTSAPYSDSLDIYWSYIKYNNNYYFLHLFLGTVVDGKNIFYVRESYLQSYTPIGLDTLSVMGFPYGDGESTSQGGQGEMTDTTEPIEIDSKPLLTTGDFLRVYKLTATDLSALQAKLISNGFLDNLIAKLRTDAMDYIVGLNAIPISAANVAASTIKIANLDTEIAASYLSWYIEDIDFGEIALTEYFQTFMDYSPYTKVSVYIPYCGIVPLNVDNFMNDKISMKCRVDMLTGQFVVFVSNSSGIVTTVSGNCAYQLPIRANDYNRLVTSGLGLLGGIVGTAGALATGNVPLAIGAGLGTVGGLVATSQAMTKPDVTSKGSLGGNCGLLGNRTPYLIIQRPTLSVPSDYGKTIGYMSRITAKLGDLTGFTVVEEIHLEHISATDDEKKLIENALKSGVIL